MKRPSFDTRCVASRYQAPTERIVEVRHPNGGGLISIRALDNGAAVIDLYQLDPTVVANVAPPRNS
ncbi:hypothetical protein IU469_30970 [Nocardia puris]|uniref:hypothetical protein n=1 Tax=Nocardia puris TaxID=208602 RepID=UPI0018942A5B|nr:hypothetical protein [Nocardia puris]MBF6215916.1 hypothetical protein [Nocardia puris]MBF6370097.1 hypothetical protein [Nocardia puris]